MGLALPGTALAAVQPPPKPKKNRIKLGISTYSYWHFKTTKVPIETVIDKTAALGVEGLDILHQQMNLPEKEPLDAAGRAYLRKLKRHAFTNGIDLMCMSIHQNFVSPDPAVRRQHVEHTIYCLDLAYQMGIPAIRLNSGRWRTVESFDKFMELRGVEPPIPGYTEDDAFKWCIDCIEQCIPKAQECGVTMALENHWGLTSSPEGMLRILNGIPASPWLGFLMDTGNFLENPYDRLEKIAPKTVFIQAKTYYGGGEWYTLDLDYKRIAKIIKNSGYHGYVSLEYEGKEDAGTAVPKSIALLREAFQ